MVWFLRWDKTLTAELCLLDVGLKTDVPLIALMTRLIFASLRFAILSLQLSKTRPSSVLHRESVNNVAHRNKDDVWWFWSHRSYWTQMYLHPTFFTLHLHSFFLFFRNNQWSEFIWGSVKGRFHNVSLYFCRCADTCTMNTPSWKLFTALHSTFFLQNLTSRRVKNSCTVTALQLVWESTRTEIERTQDWKQITQRQKSI